MRGSGPVTPRETVLKTDPMAVGSPNDIDLDADGSRCCFQVAGDSFGIFVVGIDQQSEAAGGGNQFAQQPELFGTQFAQQVAHAGRIAARPGRCSRPDQA